MGVVTALKAPRSFKGLGEKREERLRLNTLGLERSADKSLDTPRPNLWHSIESNSTLLLLLLCG